MSETIVESLRRHSKHTSVTHSMVMLVAADAIESMQADLVARKLDLIKAEKEAKQRIILKTRI